MGNFADSGECTDDALGGAVGTLVGEPNRGLEYMFIMMNEARFAVGLEGLALSERAYQKALSYAKERIQFGRPIGQLQTIQGYLAQMIMEILGSDTLTTFTAFNMDKGRHVRGYVAKAKGFSAETVGRTMDICSQIFGGMGYMEEVDSTLYLRRGKQYQLMLGGTDYWYDVAAEEMIDREHPAELI